MKRVISISFSIRLFLVVISFCAPSVLYGDELKSDQEELVIRKFDQEQINDFLTDADFKYERERAPDNSVWNQIVNWIFDKLYKLFSDPASSRIVEWTVYGIAAIILIYVLIKLFQIDITGMFYGRTKKVP